MSIGSQLKVARNVVTSKAGRQLLKGQKHSPAILFGAGVIGVVATTVMASKATLKLDAVLTENERKQGQAHDMHELSRMNKENYSTKDYKKDLAILKTQLVKDCVRLYAPAVGVGVVSIAALTGSHVILTKRNTGLMAAYAALDKSFGEYRKRITDKFGPEADLEAKFGAEDREVAEDTENGTEVKTVRSALGTSQYARFFDQTCPGWKPQPEYNLFYIRAQQQWANDMLWARGHVFLNEVYDGLGIPRSKAGAVVGWVKGHGDDRVDFGLYDSGNPFARDFVNGREGAILLDFNVDGVIYDLIEKKD
jgi:hypothetical protein